MYADLCAIITGIRRTDTYRLISYKKGGMQRISMGLVFVALLVTAPRLTLAFLTRDGAAIPQHIEVMLLTATGVGWG